MGVEEIVERINSEVNAEKETVLSEAKGKAEVKIKEAKEEIEFRKQQFVDAEEWKGHENKERIVRAARLRAKKLRWDAEEGLIGKALAEAMNRIPAVKSEGFKGEAYSNLLAGLIQDAALSIIAGGGVVNSELEVVVSAEDAAAEYVNPAMLKALSDEISKGGVKIGLSLADERPKTAGGVIVRKKDGTIIVNNTLEQRMKRFSTSLREDIVKALFKGRE